MNNCKSIYTDNLSFAASITIIVFLVITGMRYMASIINPILISGLLAISIVPILKWPMRKGLSITLSLSLTILFVVLIGLIVTVILGVAASEISQNIPFYNKRLNEIYITSIHFLSLKGFDISKIQHISVFNPDKIFSFSVVFLNNIIATFSNSILIILLTAFILIEFAFLQKKIDSGKINKESRLFNLIEIFQSLRKYISISALTGLLSAIANIILLLILGIDFALFLGFLTFIFSFIPNIGFIISLIPAVVLALLKLGLIKALIVIVGYVIINFLVDNVFKPKLMGKEFNISILTIFISLLFWTWVLGATGAILAIPLTIMIKKSFEISSRKQAGNES